ncbi:MAG: hypothetical protein EPO52_05715 [Herbiconiux sp.]|uniref:hypothetical protein n=1 Tax=Herbiconiux sp. TaxID=1871186 RepID=UPI0011FE5CFD|nr:hypothetical protein [Herbiconiux sp.]TAJ48867.1 MAG: hypothetical protein EPO52_05715 [Herbiconiux sp.]
MAISTRRVAAIVDRHALERRTIAEKLIRLLLGMWGSFDDWYDSDLVTAQSARSSVYVDAALKQSRRLSRAYMLAVLREIGAQTPTLDPIDDLYPRANIDMLEVYQRPAVQYRYALSQGKSVQQARDVAERRLKDLVETDLGIVNRDEARVVMSAAPLVIGYRRVIHPELSESGTCGLCVVAASNYYSSDDLLDIHDECKCETMPITAAADPGLQLNREDLDRIYEGAGGNDRDSLKEVRIAIGMHGEIGPVLVREADHFRDPAEIGRAPYSPPTPAQQFEKLSERKVLIDRTIDSLEERLAKGDGDPTKLRTALLSTRVVANSISQRLGGA